MEIYVALFNENDLPLGTRAYNELEKRMDKTIGNVVLVAANKFNTLKKHIQIILLILIISFLLC